MSVFVCVCVSTFVGLPLKYALRVSMRHHEREAGWTVYVHYVFREPPVCKFFVNKLWNVVLFNPGYVGSVRTVHTYVVMVNVWYFSQGKLYVVCVYLVNVWYFSQGKLHVVCVYLAWSSQSYRYAPTSRGWTALVMWVYLTKSSYLQLCVSKCDQE